MKMENEIVAPQDGTVASINVNKGDTVTSPLVHGNQNVTPWVDGFDIDWEYFGGSKDGARLPDSEEDHHAVANGAQQACAQVIHKHDHNAKVDHDDDSEE